MPIMVQASGLQPLPRHSHCAAVTAEGSLVSARSQMLGPQNIADGEKCYNNFDLTIEACKVYHGS